MAQITALQPYGVPGRTRTFTAKAAAALVAINIIATSIPALAHVADTSPNLVIAGDLEVQGSNYFGGPTNYVQVSATGNITQNGTGRTLESEKYKLTSIGGFAIKLTNKTGGNTVTGELVGPYSATAVDDAFKKGGTDSDEVFGIVLDAGVADGSEAWIVISGIANVLMDTGGSARGDRIISSTTAGSADVWNVGGAVATHFQEIGHCIETRTGAGLARCVLHFN